MYLTLSSIDCCIGVRDYRPKFGKNLTGSQNSSMIRTNYYNGSIHFHIATSHLRYESLLVTPYKYVMKVSITVLAVLLLCAGTPWAQGEGPGFLLPVDIARDGGLPLFIVDDDRDAVMQADSASDNRMIVSDNTMGRCSAWSYPQQRTTVAA